MILPCIDLLDGKVVQLVQGRDRALEADPPLTMLERFAGFAEIQIVDLDAALGRGSNASIIASLLPRCRARLGGGIRTPARAREWIAQGAYRVIVGTAAFTPAGINRELLSQFPGDRLILALDSRDGHIVVNGWRQALACSAEDLIRELEPYCAGFLCTCVQKEGMLQGTDLDWFRRLRAATSHELTAAGGITSLEEIRALQQMNVHAALGMAVYTGRLDLATLALLNRFPPDDTDATG